VKQLAEQHGADRLVVVLGLNEPQRLLMMGTTFMTGDPSYAGPLGGVALGIPSYHALELKDEVPPDVWREQMAMEELEIEDTTAEEIFGTMKKVRGE
jgi:hypothetical protein